MNIKDIVKHSPVFRLLDRRKILFFKVSLRWLWIRFFCSFPSKHFRIWCLNRYKNVKVDKRSPIYSGLEWWQGPFEIGKGSSIGFNCHIDCRKGVYIGENVCLATGVKIWTLHHDYNSVHFDCVGAPVRIGNYAWLCSYCIILPGVTIGEGAVIAAGAVVTRDVEPWTVVGGVPAKLISKREKKDYNYSPGDGWFPFV